MNIGQKIPVQPGQVSDCRLTGHDSVLFQALLAAPAFESTAVDFVAEAWLPGDDVRRGGRSGCFFGRPTRFNPNYESRFQLVRHLEGSSSVH